MHLTHAISKQRVLTLIFLIGCMTSALYMVNQKIVTDSVQLLERGYLFTQNLLVPFGPRSTNTNYVFGPFISIFVGVALSIYSHPMAPLLGILLAHCAGFFLLLKLRFLRAVPGLIPTFMFLYWLSPWRSSEVFIWNPSFLFPVMVLYLYGLDLANRRRSFAGTLIMTLAIALTFQIHKSFIFLCILSAWLAVGKKITINGLGLVLGAALSVLFLVPTAAVIIANPEILELNRGSKGLFANLFSVGEALKGVLYWLRYPSLYFGATTFQLPPFNWSEANYWDYGWILLKWVLAVISLGLVVFANVEFYKKAKGTFVWDLARGGFIALVFVSCLSPVPFNFWHLYLVYPLSLLPVAWVVSRRRLPRWAPVALGLYFVSYAAITAHRSYKHSFDSDHTRDYERLIKSQDDAIKRRFSKFSLQL